MNRLRGLLLPHRSASRIDLGGKKIIVTGASLGSLGCATAKVLLSWGAELTITCRSGSAALLSALREDLPENLHTHLFTHDLDLADARSTAAFAHWYIGRGQDLDVLINNAGIHLDLLSQWSAPALSADGVELQWRTNYLGSLHLSHLLLPLLVSTAKKTGDARIVNVVSMLHTRGRNDQFFEPNRPYNSWDAYGQSKLALMHFSNECQRRFASDGLQSFCLHPGAVFTNVASKGLAGNPLLERMRNFLAPIERFFMLTAEEGAQTTVHCATAEGIVGGGYYRDCKVVPASPDLDDRQIASQLWSRELEWLAKLAV
jgi:NAD(P)-dependent dehydrogenase (short-subunit alcohol dehydrogenase family)